MTIVEPSVDEVRKYQEKLINNDDLINYRVNQSALESLYKHPDFEKNNTLENILLKVTILNDFYSTSILDTNTVAEHIFENVPNLDRRLAEGDESLVNEIKRVEFIKKNRIINFYSFATKFCCNHNPDAFPIYDSEVHKMLNYFKKEYKFSMFKYNDLKDYSTFKRVIKEFQSYFNLEQCSLREIDHYLWLLGKELKEREEKNLS